MTTFSFHHRTIPTKCFDEFISSFSFDCIHALRRTIQSIPNITFRFTAKIQNYFPNDHDRRLTHNISIHWYSIFEARSKFKLISRFVFVFMFVYATRSYLSTHQNRQFCMHICTVSIKSFYFEFSYFWWIVFCILYFVLLCVFKHTSITNACFDWL